MSHGRDPSCPWLSFVIYTQDHDPAHIHLIGSGSAKVNLTGPEGRPVLVYNVGVSRSNMRKLLQEIVEREAEFLAAWERIHGNRD